MTVSVVWNETMDTEIKHYEQIGGIRESYGRINNCQPFHCHHIAKKDNRRCPENDKTDQ